MAWIDTTYIDSFISTEVRTDLFTDEAGSPSVTTVIDAAQSIVEAALRNAGYTPPTTTANNDLKLATLGQFLRLAYSRPSKTLELPEAYDGIVAMAQAIAVGDFEPKGLTVDQLGAVGGAEFTESDPDVTDAKTQRATRDELSGF